MTEQKLTEIARALSGVTLNEWYKIRHAIDHHAEQETASAYKQLKLLGAETIEENLRLNLFTNL